jgi:hypothetical protein
MQCNYITHTETLKNVPKISNLPREAYPGFACGLSCAKMELVCLPLRDLVSYQEPESV